MTLVANLVHRRTTCRLCDSTDLERVLQLAPSPPVDAYVTAERRLEPQPAFPLDLFLCRSCGHAQLLDVVSPELLFGDYIYETSSSPGLVEHFQSYADAVFDFSGRPAGSLAVDVGSNDGSLLQFFQEKGMRVVGVDPAREVGRKAIARGVPTVTAFLTREVASRVRDEHGAAAIVTANNVFAHSDDMHEMADSVRMLLAPDGLFVCEVSYVLDMIDGMVFDFIYHEHLCHHAVGPLRQFLRLHALELIEVQRVPTKGGSLRCFAKPIEARPSVGSSVDQLLALEASRGLQGPNIYAAFNGRIADATRAVNALTDRLRAERRSIAAYGASATGTVLIHQFALGDLLDFIVDDAPERQGRFSPGHHVPVLSSDAVYDRRPDDIFILAWRFAEMIVQRHGAYVAGGGRFIIPLPTLRTT